MAKGGVRIPYGIAKGFTGRHKPHILRLLMSKADVVNVATVKQLSPFRYPGGKTWLVPLVRNWLRGLNLSAETFVEAFAGGGIVGLTVAEERLAQKVILIELDRAVAAVWKTMLGRDGPWLIKEILTFDISRQNVIKRLAQEPSTRRELAFQTILRNRVQRGGILAPGASLMLNGEDGRGIASRWYARTLADRIEHIRSIADRIEFREGDAFKMMPRYLRQNRTTWFFDPPYTARGGKQAGSRLYSCNRIDHSRLFLAAASAAGAVMLSYDDATEVRELAQAHGLNCKAVEMKNAHHEVVRELIITNDPSCVEPRQAIATFIRNELKAWQPTLFSIS